MIGGEKHSYDMGGELPPSPRQRQRQALAVHMIDPFDIAVLCGTPVFQNATNDPQQVTCRACLRVRQRRLRRAGIKPDTETVTVASRIRGVAAPGGEF